MLAWGRGRAQHHKVRKTLQRLEDKELSRQYFRADGRYCRLKDDAGLHLYTTPEQMSEVIKAVRASPPPRLHKHPRSRPPQRLLNTFAAAVTCPRLRRCTRAMPWALCCGCVS